MKIERDGKTVIVRCDSGHAIMEVDEPEGGFTEAHARIIKETLARAVADACEYRVGARVRRRGGCFAPSADYTEVGEVIAVSPAGNPIVRWPTGMEVPYVPRTLVSADASEHRPSPPPAST